MAANNTKPLENAQKAPNYDREWQGHATRQASSSPLGYFAAYLIVLSGKIPSNFSPNGDPDALRRLAERVAPGALNRATNEGADFLRPYDTHLWDRVFADFLPGPNGTYTFLGQVMDFRDPMLCTKLFHLMKRFRDEHIHRAQQAPTPGSASNTAAGPQPLQRSASTQAVQTVHTTPAPRPSPQNTISLEERPTPSHDFPATQASHKTINHPRDDDTHEERPAKRARHQAPNAVAAPSPNPRRPQAHSASKPRTPPGKPRRAHPPQRPIPTQPPHHANSNNNAGMMPAHAGSTPYPSPPQADLPPRGPFFDPRCPDHVYFVHPHDGRRHWVPRTALPPAQRPIHHPSQAGGPSVQRPAVMNRPAAGPRAQLPTPPLTVSPAESYTANPQPPTTSVSNSNAAPTPTAPPGLIPCRWGFCTHTFSTDQTPASIAEHLKTVHSIHPEEVPPDVRRKRGKQTADGKKYICHWITKDGGECGNQLGKDGPDVGPIVAHPTATAGNLGCDISATRDSSTHHYSTHTVARMLLAELVFASIVRLAFPGALVLNHSGVPRRTPLQGL
ncbi:hypothetical protein EV121DRAFT_283555 [Schizophyllum commune]